MNLETDHPRLTPEWLELPHSTSVRNVYDEIHNERIRAHFKHGAAGNSREDANWDNAEWLPILTEELGEAAHELTYDATGEIDGVEGITSRLRKELIQVAAMAIAWVEAIDAR